MLKEEPNPSDKRSADATPEPGTSADPSPNPSLVTAASQAYEEMEEYRNDTILQSLQTFNSTPRQ